MPGLFILGSPTKIYSHLHFFLRAVSVHGFVFGGAEREGRGPAATIEAEAEREGGGRGESLTRKQPTTNFCTSSSFPPVAFLANSLRVLLSSPTPPFSLPREGREKERGRREEMYCRAP